MEKVKAAAPLAVTFLSITMAWVATVLLLQHNKFAFLCIVSAFILDSLDGTVARRLNVVSQVGRQLDSLADAFIYLLWPALAFYVYFRLTDPVSILVQMIFLVTGIYRLARFNDIGYVTWKGVTGYPGLPVVFSHLVVFLMLVFPSFAVPMWATVLILLHSILMVQRFPFPRPKTWMIIVILLAGSAIAWMHL